MPNLRPALTPKPPQRSPNEARSATPGASNLSSEPEPHRRHRGRCETPFSPPQVLSDERTRRDYDEGSDVVLQGRDEAGGLREQVGLAIHPHPCAR